MMERSKMYINSDSQIFVKVMNRKMTVLKDIINLVEVIRWLYSYFHRVCVEILQNDNKEADEIAEKAHL